MERGDFEYVLTSAGVLCEFASRNRVHPRVLHDAPEDTTVNQAAVHCGARLTAGGGV